MILTNQDRLILVCIKYHKLYFGKLTYLQHIPLTLSFTRRIFFHSRKCYRILTFVVIIFTQTTTTFKESRYFLCKPLQDITLASYKIFQAPDLVAEIRNILIKSTGVRTTWCKLKPFATTLEQCVYQKNAGNYDIKAPNALYSLIFSYFIRISVVCHSYVIVCYRAALVCRAYLTRCTLMTSACHPYITRICSYVVLVL